MRKCSVEYVWNCILKLEYFNTVSHLIHNSLFSKSFIACLKASSPASAIWCFLYLLFSLRSSSSCLHLLPLLFPPSLSFCIFPSITCFKMQFLHRLWPIQVAFHCFIVCRMFLSWLHVMPLHFSHDQTVFSILLKHHISNLKPTIIIRIVCLPT